MWSRIGWFDRIGLLLALVNFIVAAYQFYAGDFMWAVESAAISVAILFTYDRRAKAARDGSE